MIDEHSKSMQLTVREKKVTAKNPFPKVSLFLTFTFILTNQENCSEKKENKY